MARFRFRERGEQSSQRIAVNGIACSLAFGIPELLTVSLTRENKTLGPSKASSSAHPSSPSHHHHASIAAFRKFFYQL